MKTALKVIALTVLTTAFYAYVGNMVPQKITYPPQDVELRSDMTTEEMVKAGQEIVGGKGTCLSCHTIGSHEAGRFPDLGGIGVRAESRKEGMDDVEYLAESLYDPDAYIVDGFKKGMLAANKPPISLSDEEILSVIAYLQSLGGMPTVTMKTKTKWAGASPKTPTPRPATTVAASAEAVVLGAEELMRAYACVTCHSLDTPDTLIGPSLYDVGNRLTVAELYESILNPDATITEGFPQGVMTVTLTGLQFFDKVSTREIKTIVDFLAARKGGE